MGGMGGMDPGMMQAGRGSECTGACWSTDGSAINSDACTCGEDVCAMNQFCDASAASGSECTSHPYSTPNPTTIAATVTISLTVTQVEVIRPAILSGLALLMGVEEKYVVIKSIKAGRRLTSRALLGASTKIDFEVINPEGRSQQDINKAVTAMAVDSW